ncbi:FkbM family methyltransferase [Thiohalobacter sp. IOR34]|uniref:FkbM family methyltransferase n=1 Tax=Thiohalobacter sp. IOR34 TaxID=3057176 RepID=UPI0025B0719F|nr:FkbM family methyltransferase [Thiohalobacter sp. IOR34]WJW76278.1 FkbM family methyltransferase [Thiohalobacter sp. IOR34]
MTESLFKLQIHHVGGRDGEIGEFPLNRHFLKDMVFHVYDSDESCLPQVESICRTRGMDVVLHPYVVDDREGAVDFSLNYCPCTSSLLPPASYKREQYSPLLLFGDYVYAETFKPVKNFRVSAVTLDSLARRRGFGIDFLSIDTQGTEDRVLSGAEQQLKKNVVAVLCEVEMHELYAGQALFGDLLSAMRRRGFHFMRFFMREARVNFYRAGIGFRGDGMMMAADALFFKDVDHLEDTAEHPAASLLKLAFVALSFGYVEYALDCLERVFGEEGSHPVGEGEVPEYVDFLARVWGLYRESAYIPLPSFAQLYTFEEALRRFEPDNPHPWTTFDRDRVLGDYFSKVDVGRFLESFPQLLEQQDTAFEELLRGHGMESVADLVKDKRVRQAHMIVESLGLGEKAADGYRLRISEALSRLGIQGG